MARKDIHRPAEIIPADYEFIASDYLGPEPDDFDGLACDRLYFIEHMKQTGGRYSSHDHAGTCHICGAHALWISKFHHAKTNTYIVTGTDCAVKMSMGNPAKFRSFKKRIQAGLEAAAGKGKAQKFLEMRDLSAAWEIYVGNNSGKEESIITDIVSKLVRYGDISINQIALIEKLLGQIEVRDDRNAERRAADALSQHFGTIGTRVDLDLSVVFITTYETFYGLTTVTGMKDAAGNIFIHKGTDFGASKGSQVRIKATIKEHGEREGVKQTLLSRPKLIEEKEQLAA
jgi:hypothetical protein